MKNLDKIKQKSAKSNNFLQRYAILLVWGIIIVAFSLILPDTFPTWLNFTTILSSKATLVVLSLAVMIPLIAGDFDISTASTLVLTNMVIAVLNAKLGVSLAICLPIALVVGALVGFINGFFVVRIGIHSFIVTLGISTLLNGITLWISNSRTVSGIDRIMQEWVISKRIFGISYIFFYALIVCVILFYFLEYTAAGKKLLYVGRGINVSRLSGINVTKVRWSAFIASGTVSALAGIMYAGTTGSADPSSGLSFMMPAFAGAFFGSTCLKPGRFNAWGCFIAIYFLVTGVTGFSLMGAPTFIQSIFYGLALVIAVSFAAIVKKRQIQSAIDAGIAAAESKE